jgi:hypothetical protein
MSDRIPRKVLSPSEYLDLLLAGSPPTAHDLVHWADASGGEHTALVPAYVTFLEATHQEAEMMKR